MVRSPRLRTRRVSGKESRRHEERKATTQSRLLATGREVLKARGLAGLTLDEVAERAELTKGAVYGNFGDKEEFVLAVIDSLADEMEPVPSWRDAATWEEARQRAAAEVRGIPREVVALKTELLAESFANPPLRRLKRAQWRAKTRALAAELERMSGKCGPLAAPPAEMAVLADALLFGLAEVRLLAGSDAVPDALFEKGLELLFGS